MGSFGLSLRLQSPYTGVSTPLSPKKSQKGLPGASQAGVPRRCRKSPRTLILTPFLTPFWVFWDFFDTFLALRLGRPGKTFLRLFGDFGAQGCGDSCIPSDTKLLLTKNDSEIYIYIYFRIITNLTRNSLKMSFFRGHFESTNGPQNYEKYRSSKWHDRQRKTTSELILHFITDTDTDENYFGIKFCVADTDTVVFCSCDIADKNCFGNNFCFIAVADTEKYCF